MATNYAINYNDKRFTEVEADKQAALTDNENLYGGMINNSDKYFQSQIDAVNDYKTTQTKIQNEQTDFAIEQINQQKQQAEQDYTKEQKGAYVDWQKESNRYGANAEAMAQNGLAASGYSESSQVSMYNTYQNRVATAREAYGRAVLNYDNAIKDARLQNNAALAEIAYNALQKELELSLEGFQYKNTLLIEQANKKAEIDDRYYTRYQGVLNQINTENALAEQVRQANLDEAYRRDTLALQKAQLEEEKRQYNLSYELQKKNSSVSGGGGSSGGSRISSSKGSSSKSSGGSSSSTKAKSNGGNTISKDKVLSKVSSVKTYEQAQALMQAFPIKKGNTRLLTRQEWALARKEKGLYSESEYKTYKEYVQYWLRWRIEESF